MSSTTQTSDQDILGSLKDIEEGGKGLRFSVKALDPRPGLEDEEIPAFVVKYDGQPRAFLNRCGHIAVQLDYSPGEFFSDDGQTLMCATHGAEYAPDTGACLGGPCYGIGLEPLNVSLVGDDIILNDDRYTVYKQV